MKKIGDLKFRDKLILGLFMVIAMMMIAVIMVFNGFSDGKVKLESLWKISEEQVESLNIQENIIKSRAYYQSYLRESNENDRNNFYDNINDMEKDIRSFDELSEDSERKRIIQDIESLLVDYKREFGVVEEQVLKDIEIHKNLLNTGNMMLDRISVIQRRLIEIDGRENGEEQENQKYILVSKLMENVLLSRLVAFRYYTFQKKEDYDGFIETFNELEEDIKELGGILKDVMLVNHLDEYEKHQKQYFEYMKNLRGLFSQRADSMERIKVKEREILAGINSINENINTDKSEHLMSMRNNYNRKTILMAVFILMALINSIIVCLWLMKITLTPIKYLTNAFGEISQGEVDLDFRLNEEKKDEFGIMAESFNKLMIKLKNLLEEIRKQNKIKSAEIELNESVDGVNKLDTIAENVLDITCDYFNALAGTMYICNGINYKKRAGYNFGVENENLEFIDENTGLIGECIKSKEMKIYNSLDEDRIVLKTSLMGIVPKSMIIIPCIYEDDIKGIIEIVCDRDIDDTDIEIAGVLSRDIAIIIERSKANIRIKSLLAESLEQRQALQAQQEELRENNEELEEQTRILSESQKRLQIQQEELKVTNEELETRTEELENQKREINLKNLELIQAQKNAEEKANALEVVNKYKTEFLANMSHELRTPLNSILVLSQMLNDKNIGDKLTNKDIKFAKTINLSGRELLNIINDILDLSKVEAGHLNINEDEIDITDIATYNMELFKPLCERKGIEFLVNIENGMDQKIFSDELRLNQVLRNFLSNAVKFTEKGKILLNIREENNGEIINRDNGEEYVVFEVMDTGIGIPEDKKQTIFEAFKQVDGSISRKYGGTGLGLTISKELTQLLNGKLKVDSKEGKGSCFRLILPRRLKKFKVNYNEKQRNLIQEEICADIYDRENDELVNDIELLIVEDDSNFGEILSGIAKDRNINVKLVKTGREGIEFAQRYKPNAIILDLGLPDMDGEEVINRLHENESTKGISIHVISGKEENSKIRDNIIGYLKKPADIKKIYELLGKIEDYSNEKLKKLLVVGECQEEDFRYFIDLAGVKVVKVKDGKEALEKIEEDQYECIITDNLLMDMEVKEFIFKANDIMKRKHIESPFVIFAENDFSKIKESGLDEIVDRVILNSPKAKERLVDEVSVFLQDISKGIVDFGADSGRILPEKEDFPGNKDQIDEVNTNLQKEIGVLIVDDDERNIFALKSFLEKENMNVTEAYDGEECLDKLKENNFDLILMDIMMPNKDGMDTIRCIRNSEDSRIRNIPIIALTAKAMRDDRKKCIQAGADDYMSKPIECNELKKKIINSIKKLY